jgi:hypothetical protein
MGHELIQLLFHIEFHRLSQGKWLTGPFLLRDEVKIYLHGSESQAADMLSCGLQNWHDKLMFSASWEVCSLTASKKCHCLYCPEQREVELRNRYRNRRGFGSFANINNCLLTSGEEVIQVLEKFAKLQRKNFSGPGNISYLCATLNIMTAHYQTAMKRVG